MITGKLSNGFEVTMDEEVIKTYRFAKLIGQAVSKDNNEKMYANSKILSFLIGDADEEALLEYMKEKLGHEPTEKEVSDITIEIINLAKTEDEDIKKSASSDES